MLNRESKYYQTITALPLLQGKLGSDFEHMTRISFDKSLKSLKDGDLKMVKDLEDFIIWEKRTMENATDKEFKKMVLALKNRHNNKTFLEIINFTTQKRLLLGLLRKRKNGLEEAPDSEEIWALSDIEYNIKNNWKETDFGLKNLGVNLSGFDELLQSDETLTMEQQILQLMWKFCNRMSNNHYFDIDFILVYAMRRSIIERWKLATTPQDITEKFNQLAMEAINGREEESDS